MQNVKIEMKNIEWANDAINDDDWETPPEELLFVICFWDCDIRSDEDIDEAIANHLENEYGFRPVSWDLWMFDGDFESECAQGKDMNTIMTIITGIGAIAILIGMCAIPALLAGGIVANHSQKNNNQSTKKTL